MKTFATAYVNLFDNNAVADLITAENELDTLKKTILKNQTDSHTKEWIEGIPDDISIQDFKNEVLQGEQSVDAKEI
jgi:hypothetical protein